MLVCFADMRLPMTGVIAQDVEKVLPDAVGRSGPCTLSNGQQIDNVLIVDKDRIFLGKSRSQFEFPAKHELAIFIRSEDCQGWVSSLVC